MFQQDISIGEVVSLQNSALLKIMIFVLFILTLKFHLLQKSSYPQRRVCKPLAYLDKSTMSSAYIRQDICKPQLPSGTGSHWSSKHFDKSFRYNKKSSAQNTTLFDPYLSFKRIT